MHMKSLSNFTLCYELELCTNTRSNLNTGLPKDAFTYDSTFHLDDDFLINAPQAAPPPPTTSTKIMRQTANLSEFDIIIDIPLSERSSPICETSISSSIPSRQHDSSLQSLHPTRSPMPSLTSMSACSSTETPITPGASDDKCLYLQTPCKDITFLHISFHSPSITHTTPSPSNPNASPVEIFLFTLAPFSPFPEMETEEEEEHEGEDNVSWYLHGLSPFVSVSSLRDPSSTSPAWPNSLPPLPHVPSSNTSRPAPRSQMSKPLPAIPHSSHPSPEMDPTFSQRKSRCPLLLLPDSSQFPSPPSTIPHAVHLPSFSTQVTHDHRSQCAPTHTTHAGCLGHPGRAHCVVLHPSWPHKRWQHQQW